MARRAAPSKLERAQVEAFLARDWGAVRRQKEAHWRRQKRGHRLEVALAATDALAEQARMMYPGWPTPEQREADLQAHQRLAALLALTARSRPRR